MGMMSLRNDRQWYDKLYAERSKKAWAPDPDSVSYSIDHWSDRILLVGTGIQLSRNIEDLLDKVEIRDSLGSWNLTQALSKAMAGWYHGKKVTIINTIVTPYGSGAPYVDYALERIRHTAGCRIVLIGECTSINENVLPGDLVLPFNSIRDDDSHLSYASPEIPSLAEPELSKLLISHAKDSGRKVHAGTTWSCGTGAGIFDPTVADRLVHFCHLGVLANATEAATAYLLGSLMNFQISSLWLVADSLFQPITWKCPLQRLDWQAGWDTLVLTALNSLAELD
jgi:purine-nucleoside phosphorylase